MDKLLISVLTLVSGREKAFRNFVEGLKQSTTPPHEVIVVFMNQEPCAIEVLPFQVKTIRLNHTGTLPLASARNRAAKEASGDLLIFLDVDCIADANLIANYASAKQSESLLVGQVRYLQNNADEHPQFLKQLIALSRPDPIRAGVNPLPYELFWSLNFACSKSIFNSIGGFDEDFIGYGGEDTDFAFKARAVQIPLKTIDALAFHQHHPSYSPPLNHFRDIISNAECFYQKWKIWPMEGWINKFEEMGLVIRKPDKIEVLRLPKPLQIEQAVKD
ncbi:hypothetical protein DHW03_06465 [Pedobacter yonginense]|uniref:Glycosyltransferase 2-like prokaryotic type domain-containing protein n=1 Tax=Pedobacter yonginense TaxID=651869 RepID=A0A317ESQ1_9SPHI|nr:galactosyltransferase-related protein [Pedobacter yonginense]PWS29452.1 hypothetical protein DHW03_06465 [Pedobacter yonginense]